MSNINRNKLKLSLIIPAYNEEMNIVPTLDELLKTLRTEGIPFEIIVVNDNCKDNTQQLVEEEQPTGFRECVVYIPGTGGQMLITVGPSGSDYSMDGGRTWKNFDTIGFHSVSFPPGSRVDPVGWAVGAGGRIAKCQLRQ